MEEKRSVKPQGRDSAPQQLLPQCPPHRLVVHVRLVLLLPPQLGHSFGVHQLKDALLSLGPLDILRAGVPVLQKREEELPQVDGAACRGPGGEEPPGKPTPFPPA